MLQKHEPLYFHQLRPCIWETVKKGRQCYFRMARVIEQLPPSNRPQSEIEVGHFLTRNWFLWHCYEARTSTCLSGRFDYTPVHVQVIYIYSVRVQCTEQNGNFQILYPCTFTCTCSSAVMQRRNWWNKSTNLSQLLYWCSQLCYRTPLKLIVFFSPSVHTAIII